MAPWGVEWLVRTDCGKRTIPAFSFLLAQPPAVRTTSHDSMHGPCARLHEARDRHGQMLYRLYLRWEREQRRVIVIDGGAKPNASLRCF